MSFDLYFRLYVQTEISEDKLKCMAAEYINGKKDHFSVVNEYIVADFRKNDSYDIGKFNTEKRFVFSRYTAEIEPMDDMAVDKEAYIESLCDLILKLRKSGAQVVASCEYEDLIAEKTGWNWSEATPDHPSVA